MSIPTLSLVAITTKYCGSLLSQGRYSGLAFCKYTANYVDSESILSDFPPTVILNTHNNKQVRKYA